MADDNNPSPTSPDLPPPAHAVTTAADAAPPAAARSVTTVPAPSLNGEDIPASPADIAWGLLRSVLHAALGGVVGLSLGFVVYFCSLRFFNWNNSTLILLLGGGLLLGVAFCGTLVRLLGLTPRGRTGARSLVVGGEDGRSEIELVAGWLLGAILVLACGWGLMWLGYFVAGPASGQRR